MIAELAAIYGRHADYIEGRGIGRHAGQHHPLAGRICRIAELLKRLLGALGDGGLDLAAPRILAGIAISGRWCAVIERAGLGAGELIAGRMLLHPIDERRGITRAKASDAGHLESAHRLGLYLGHRDIALAGEAIEEAELLLGDAIARGWPALRSWRPMRCVSRLDGVIGRVAILRP